MADLEALKETIPIRDLAEKLGLAFEGREAFCLWHDDQKTPNLHLNENTNRFKCYRCGAVGSVIDLAMKAKDLDVKGAVRWLSEEFEAAESHNGEKRTNGRKRKRGDRSTRRCRKRTSILVWECRDCGQAYERR